MQEFLLAILLIVAVAMIAFILMQHSDGGALGMGGGPSGMMTARGAADFLTRTTAILATIFILTALALSIVSSRGRKAESVLDVAAAPKSAPAIPTPGSAPKVPAGN